MVFQQLDAFATDVDQSIVEIATRRVVLELVVLGILLESDVQKRSREPVPGRRRVGDGPQSNLSIQVIDEVAMQTACASAIST